MKILAIYGSPCKGGSSERLLDEVLKPLAEEGIPFKKIHLADLKIYPCNACYGCRKNGHCVLKDDLTGLYDEVEETSHLIIAAPIFFNGVPAQLKAFIDRFQAFYMRYFVLKLKKPPLKKGYFLSVAGSKNKDVFAGAIKTIEIFLQCLCGRLEKKLCATSVEKKGDIEKQPDVLRAAYKIGKEIASEKAKT